MKRADKPTATLTAKPAPAAGYRRGVGIVLLNTRKEVFVGRRIDTADDAWQMPQGGIDGDETPAQAAMRELEEETGTAAARIIAESGGWYHYDLPPRLAATVWQGRFRGQAQKWFAMAFEGRDGDIDIAAGDAEFDAWRWLPAARLPMVIVPFKRPLYEAVLAEFGPLLGAG